jgi:hypothetical protein
MEVERLHAGVQIQPTQRETYDNARQSATYKSALVMRLVTVMTKGSSKQDDVPFLARWTLSETRSLSSAESSSSVLIRIRSSNVPYVRGRFTADLTTTSNSNLCKIDR